MGGLEVLIAILGGFFAGIINTLAGSGSAITLTILTEVLGLPGNVANGTNRIGVFTQSAAGSFAFYQNDRLDLKRSRPYFIATVVGAVTGVLVAVMVSNAQFKFVFRWLMVGLLLLILIRPKRWLRETDPDGSVKYWIAIPTFLAIGFYGGFIQMGMGVVFLAAMVLGAKYSIIDANAVKLSVVAFYTVLVIAIFHYQGLIEWWVGAVLAIGQTVGGYLTAHYASRMPQANVWAHRLLVVVVVGAIIKMFSLWEYVI